MAIFSERLKEIRKNKGLTQKQAAEGLNILERNYQHFEAKTGGRKPSFDTLIALADYFDVSLDYLTGRSDKPKRY